MPDVISRSANDRIVLSVIVKTPPERVFRALTDARELSKWFPTEVETDPRPGGAYKFTWLNQDSSTDHSRTGQFIEVIPGRKVSYTWDARPMKGNASSDSRPLPTLVEWLLEPVPDGTRVTLTHGGWGEDAEWREMFGYHDEGWTFFIGNLQTVIEEGKDRRVQDMEMRVK